MTRLRSMWNGLALALAFAALDNAETAPQSESRIMGKVMQLDGNFMPTTNPPGPSGVTAPLSVPVYIFQGKVPFGRGTEPLTPALDDRRIVRIVQADASGSYETRLPSGTYTVFALIDGKLYLNEMDGVAHYTTLSVRPGEIVTKDIHDNRKAWF